MSTGAWSNASTSVCHRPGSDWCYSHPSTASCLCNGQPRFHDERVFERPSRSCQRFVLAKRALRINCTARVLSPNSIYVASRHRDPVDPGEIGMTLCWRHVTVERRAKPIHRCTAGWNGMRLLLRSRHSFLATAMVDSLTQSNTAPYPCAREQCCRRFLELIALSPRGSGFPHTGLGASLETLCHRHWPRISAAQFAPTRVACLARYCCFCRYSLTLFSTLRMYQIADAT